MFSIRPCQRCTKGGEQPHEATQADELDTVLVEDGLQRGFEGRAILAEGLVVEHRGRHAGLCARVSRPAASGRLDSTSAISAG